MRRVYSLFFFLLMILAVSCSHKYNAEVQDLNFYQWNLWQDSGADPEAKLPSVGWEELHRGKGKLVRIPASLEEHFPDNKGAGVYWYHCRFTLPEQWEHRPISLLFREAGPGISVFLNEQEVGSFQAKEGAFELDVSEQIYYIRDNHLSIRVEREGEPESGKHSGITGTILVVPGMVEKVELEAIE